MNETSFYNIETPLRKIFDSQYENYWGKYRQIAPALECNHIITVRDACRLSMEDLVVITGKPRHELYFFQKELQTNGFLMPMTLERAHDLYVEWRNERYLDDLYDARIKQLKAQKVPDAEETARKERENNALPIVEDLRQQHIDDIEGFYIREENLRHANQALVEKIKKELCLFLELQRAK